ncbi:endonuclease/exonuclease/phosphatase family protein [Pelagicoccus sp. SDUM812002]|uniref:endonuclease/exonuclease/phosphatase family protein n=1 Tax=Pelagicoccus sp. SDUM812002 TaxID=3041266 RepID=UPI0028109524|nr:endonuclease/exonuclease/phosphatase family protein [Pelagicoccus sp. SDUM812002]MDQ8187733.1 endonuclease/exonuclease/phosphatase family protein [Pelagicoccus sp. SDUM812002]
MSISEIACICLSFLVLLCAVIPFLRFEGWWVRGFDFPRLQFASLAGILLAVDLWILDFESLWSWAAVGGCLLALGIEAWWILPYTCFWKEEVVNCRNPESGESIAMMTANVLQTNRNADGFLKIVLDAQPDILVTLETDQWWQDKLDVLEREHGYHHTAKCPIDNLYGMLVYSRFELENTKIQQLVEENVPSVHTLARLENGRAIRLHFIHPAPPSPSENTESSERDAELTMVGKSVSKALVPAIVTGDLNDVAWSGTTRLFREASGMRDVRIGRGMFNTFHAKLWCFRWPLDHLFCSKHFELATIRRLPKYGSDHFSMYVKLVLTPKDSNDSEPLKPDEDDKEMMDEKLDDENVSPNDVHQPDR